MQQAKLVNPPVDDVEDTDCDQATMTHGGPILTNLAVPPTHEPHWITDMAEFVIPRRSLLLRRRRYLTRRCCGRGMYRGYLVLNRRCSICNRVQSVKGPLVAYCGQCGHRENHFSDDGGIY